MWPCVCIIFFIYTYYFFFRNPSRQNIHGKSGPRVIFGRQNAPDRIAICLIIIDVRRRTVKNVTWPLGTREWFFTGNVFVIHDDSRFVRKHVRLEMVLFTNGYAPYVPKKQNAYFTAVLAEYSEIGQCRDHKHCQRTRANALKVIFPLTVAS